MLIEAQAQTLLLDQKKSTQNEDDGKKDPLAMDVEENDSKDGLKSDGDVEMKELDEKSPEESEKKKSLEEESIDIDPKTFCKLGHFHLLLEDYAKGKCNLFLLE